MARSIAKTDEYMRAALRPAIAASFSMTEFSAGVPGAPSRCTFASGARALPAACCVNPPEASSVFTAVSSVSPMRPMAPRAVTAALGGVASALFNAARIVTVARPSPASAADAHTLLASKRVQPVDSMRTTPGG